VLAAEGYECERTCGAPVGEAQWSERVVVRSPMHATHQAAGLATRLRHAETKLAARTPLRGRGKRHITDGEEILRRLTPLSGVQEDILQRLGLGTSLYGQLEIQEMGN